MVKIGSKLKRIAPLPPNRSVGPAIGEVVTVKGFSTYLKDAVYLEEYFDIWDIHNFEVLPDLIQYETVEASI